LPKAMFMIIILMEECIFCRLLGRGKGCSIMGSFTGRFRIRTKLAFGFLLIFFIFVVVGLMQWYNIRDLNSRTGEIMDTVPLVNASKEMRLIISVERNIITMLLLEDNPTRIDALWASHVKNVEEFNRFTDALLKGGSTSIGYIEMTTDPDIVKNLKDASNYLTKSFVPQMDRMYDVKIWELNDENVEVVVKKLKRSVAEMENISEVMLSKLRQVDLLAAKQMDRVRDGSNAKAREATAWTLIAIVVAALISLFLGFGITEDIVRPINECVNLARDISQGILTSEIKLDRQDEPGILALALNQMSENLRRTIREILQSAEIIATSSEELSVTTDQLARGARSQSSQSEQTATSMTEMSQTILEVARNAGEVSDSAKDTREKAEEGLDRVSMTLEGIKRIADTVIKSTDTIKSLGSSSEHIGEIISTINDIADQTNLLALNAAIEAARAGEQGRGFAVVADEVRKLAERTARSTGEIGEMITRIQTETDASVATIESGREEVGTGVALADDAMAALGEIVESSKKSAEMVQRIASATEQQSAAIEEVSTTIESIAQVSTQAEAASSQIQNSSQDLARIAAETKETLKWFKL